MQRKADPYAVLRHTCPLNGNTFYQIWFIVNSCSANARAIQRMREVQRQWEDTCEPK